MANVATIVAYLGPRATYSHQAALIAYPVSKAVEHLPLTTIPAVFSAVQSGTATAGLVPFFNSTYGAVVATLDSFATALDGDGASPLPVNGATGHGILGRFPQIKIKKAIKVPVRHCLLVHKLESGSTSDRPKAFSRIKKVYSHEQGLGQCAQFLSTHLPSAEQVSVTSTSKAAELVAEEADDSVAAISSAAAAGEFGVSVLQEGCQDLDDNTTQFFVLEKESDVGRIGSILSNSDEVPAEANALIVFTVSHAVPGALFKALEVLFKHRLNMTGIYQRPPNETRKEDAIFVELTGVVGDDVMNDLERVTTTAKCLGTW